MVPATELQVGDAVLCAVGQGVSRSSDQVCTPASPWDLAYAATVSASARVKTSSEVSLTPIIGVTSIFDEAIP
nr:hypothetical protein [Curtobacterium sp. MCLR17_043]